MKEKIINRFKKIKLNLKDYFSFLNKKDKFNLMEVIALMIITTIFGMFSGGLLMYGKGALNTGIKKELNEFVLEKINTLLQKFYSQDNLNELKDNMVEKDLFQEKIKALEKELDSIEKELENKSSYFQRLYEDRLNGILPEKEFLILMNKYKDDIEKFEERKKLIIKEISITNQKKETLKSKKNIFKKYEHIRKLNVEIVGDFIDKILVGKYDEESNTREINIIWNFTI